MHGNAGQSKYLLILVILFVGICTVAIIENTISGQDIDGIGSIETDNYANKNLEYYYYVPGDVLRSPGKSCPLLVLVTGLSGNGQDFVSKQFKNFAQQENFAIIAPSFKFDETNWSSKRSYQYPSVWSGLAFLKMVKQLETQSGLTFDGYNFIGISAGAQFALRFSLWRPELCKACTAHASGGAVSPARFVEVDYLITIGDQDTDQRKAHAQNLYDAARKQGINIQLKRYPVGHILSQAQIKDSFLFIKAQQTK